MISETVIGWTAVGTLFGMVTGCGLYMQGGRSKKWIRRFIGSLVIAASVNVASIILGIWEWSLCLIYPALALAFCFGYGASDFIEKVLKRSIYAIAVIGSGLVFCFTYGENTWLLFIHHVCIGAWSVYIGIKNPIHAAAEEVFVCGMLNFGLCMYPFIIIS